MCVPVYKMVRTRSKGENEYRRVADMRSKIAPLKENEYKLINVKWTPNKFKVLIGCLLCDKDAVDQFVNNYLELLVQEVSTRLCIIIGVSIKHITLHGESFSSSRTATIKR